MTKHHVFLAVLFSAALVAIPFVNAKPSKLTYTTESLKHKSSADLLRIIASMEDPTYNCGMCFVPDVGPEDPTCGDCHYACTWNYGQEQCVSCSQYDHGYNCYDVMPTIIGAPLASAAAKDLFTLPSVLRPKKNVLLTYSGMQKYGSNPPHPREADDVRRWYIATASHFKKCGQQKPALP